MINLKMDMLIRPILKEWKQVNMWSFRSPEGLMRFVRSTIILQHSQFIYCWQVLHHRVRSLENINMDLEYRLEQQAKMTFYAEQRYTDIDNAWQQKYMELQKVHEYDLYQY
jgi:hypothetical protein